MRDNGKTNRKSSLVKYDAILVSAYPVSIVFQFSKDMLSSRCIYSFKLSLFSDL